MIATNNTIAFAASNAAESAAFMMTQHGGLIALNNLIFGEAPFQAFRENQDTNDTGYLSDPRSLDNNVIVATASPTFVYADNEITPAVQSIAAMEELLWCQDTPAAGNQLVISAFSAIFVDVDGLDNDINTLADNDWHLLATAPLAVRTGGIGPSGPTGGCGTAIAPTGYAGYMPAPSGCTFPARGGEPCNLIPTDAENVPRTTPWSVGAYERD